MQHFHQRVGEAEHGAGVHALGVDARVFAEREVRAVNQRKGVEQEEFFGRSGGLFRHRAKVRASAAEGYSLSKSNGEGVQPRVACHAVECHAERSKSQVGVAKHLYHFACHADEGSILSSQNQSFHGEKMLPSSA
ncbi:hypothetical protein ACFQT0_04350 [Hymenobacter humi]|uniref:Uncharacterized protein n=1 Tax=Hymenobacter humi TaxID=1411620 RepID=A0ABW2TZR7_9BACT